MEKNSDIPLNQTILYALGIVGICFIVFSVTKCSSTPEMTQALEACQKTVTIVIDETNKVDKFVNLDSYAPAIESATKCREDVTNVFRDQEKNSLIPKLPL